MSNATAQDKPAHDPSAARLKTKKSAGAFRTISEVADELHIPQHVLRFWETKFPQVKPLKRGGGRRYYRPDDISLLRRISDLLYIQGYTIKGVQRLLREGGGKLSDNIPPPTPDERDMGERDMGERDMGERDMGEHEPDVAAEAEAIAAREPMLPMPGLALARVAARPAPRGRADPIPDPEIERLRGLLVDTLAELESLRALLGGAG